MMRMGVWLGPREVERCETYLDDGCDARDGWLCEGLCDASVYFSSLQRWADFGGYAVMKYPLLCLLAMVVPMSAKNLFSNGTMDTAGGWKGSKKIEQEAKKTEAGLGLDEKAKPNRYLAVSGNMKELQTFSQDVDSKGVITLNLKFRYKSKDYIGRGLEIRGVRQSRDFTYISMPLISDGEWHEISWEYDQVSGSRKIDFQFSLLQGKGDVFFDDFVVEPTL
jgi:hypothetical protein